MLRSTRRGLETWHGRDSELHSQTKERANREHEVRPKPARPVPDPTDEPRGVETELRLSILRHRRTKGAETDVLSLTPPRHTSYSTQ